MTCCKIAKKKPLQGDGCCSKEVAAEFSAFGSNRRWEAETGGGDDPAGWEDRAWQSAGWDVLGAIWFAVLAGLMDLWSVRSECSVFSSKSAGQQEVFLHEWFLEGKCIDGMRRDELEKLSFDLIVPLTLSGCEGGQPDVLYYSSTESSLKFP